MKEKKCLVSVVIAVFLLIAIDRLSQAQEPERSISQDAVQEWASQPSDALAITELVSTTFSYQGLLKEGGHPVTDERQMVFRLYIDDGCTSMIGNPITHTVAVDNGLFHVNLLVNPADFNGQALWLETEVSGISVGCQAIQAVPYALSLRPGAIIGPAPYGVAGITSLSASGAITDIHPGGALFYRAGGEFAGPNGIIGAASSDTPAGYGVIGLTQGTNGSGGYFENTAGGADIELGGSGNVAQTRTGNGVIKAAVYAYCAGSSFTPSISRSFNTVNGATFSAYPGEESGECIIDFNFQVNDRFWVATVEREGAFFASCGEGDANDRLNCGLYNYNGGSPPGYIMILIY